MDGIAVHADSASVNLNFWVTPDDANLDPDSGGLVVYPKVPPEKGAAADHQPEKDVRRRVGTGDKEQGVPAWDSVDFRDRD